MISGKVVFLGLLATVFAGCVASSDVELQRLQAQAQADLSKGDWVRLDAAGLSAILELEDVEPGSDADMFAGTELVMVRARQSFSYFGVGCHPFEPSASILLLIRHQITKPGELVDVSFGHDVEQADLVSRFDGQDGSVLARLETTAGTVTTLIQDADDPIMVSANGQNFEFPPDERGLIGKAFETCAVSPS